MVLNMLLVEESVRLVAKILKKKLEEATEHLKTWILY